MQNILIKLGAKCFRHLRVKQQSKLGHFTEAISYQYHLELLTP